MRQPLDASIPCRMSTTSKSPRKVALVALAAAREALPAYAHRFSPRIYTQHQVFACLVLKVFFKTDYRGIAAMLADMGESKVSDTFFV